MHRGIGVTTLCIAISNFLINKQFSSVAYLEVNSTNEIHNLNTRNKTNHFKYLGIDFDSAVTLDDLSSLLQEKYDEKYMYYGKTSALSLHFEEEVEWTLDGEFGGQWEEVEIETCPKKLEIAAGVE